MFSTQAQFPAATKNNLNAQVAFFTNLTSKAFESVEKIVGLNMTVIKTSLEEFSAPAKQLVAAKDPQEFLSLTTALASPNGEKAIAYGRELAAIAAAAQAELTKAAEVQIIETNRQVIALVDDISKLAPAGSEGAIALVKSAIANTNAGFDQLSKTGKQAAEALEANVTTAVQQFSSAAQTATSRAKKQA